MLFWNRKLIKTPCSSGESLGKVQLPGSVPENWQHYTRAQMKKTGTLHVFAVLILIELQWDGNIKGNL